MSVGFLFLYFLLTLALEKSTWIFFGISNCELSSATSLSDNSEVNLIFLFAIFLYFLFYFFNFEKNPLPCFSSKASSRSSSFSNRLMLFFKEII